MIKFTEAQKYKIEYSISFFISSSFLFSNVELAGIQLNNFFSIISFLIAFFYFNLSSLILLFILAFFILLSTIVNANNVNYFIAFLYKLLTLYPVILLVNKKSYKVCLSSSFHAFIISNLIALIYLMLNNGTRHTFIIYYDLIPRYAALAKEPSSFAMFSLGIYMLIFFNNPKFKLSKCLSWYIPILISISSVFIVKLLADIFWRYKKNIYFHWILLSLPLLLFITLLWNSTRISDSIVTRLEGYLGLLKEGGFIFFGSGIYQLKGFSDGLPGFFRIYYEIGFIFFLLMWLFIFFKIYTLHLWKNPILFIAIFYPFLTEAYGAQFMWLIFGFGITYKIDTINSFFISNKILKGETRN